MTEQCKNDVCTTRVFCGQLGRCLHVSSEGITPRQGETTVVAAGATGSAIPTRQSITDTDRLNAVFNLFGGAYAFGSPYSPTDVLRRGRDGIDDVILTNPTLLPNRRSATTRTENLYERPQRI